MQSEIQILTITGYGNNPITNCLPSVNKCYKYINKQMFQKVHKNSETNNLHIPMKIQTALKYTVENIEF